MSPEPASTPNPATVEAQAEQAAQHRRLLQETNAALAASPAPALLDCVQTIHRIVLAADPRALRRSVSWWGRLLARDITLQAESEALRGQLGVHVVQARQQLRALFDSDRQLQALGVALQAAIDELDRQSAALAKTDHASHADPDGAARRMHQLATLATSLQITASHLDLTLLNHRELSQRVGQMLPQVELLLDQQRMLRAGLSERAALKSAASAMESLSGLKPVSSPHVTPDDFTPEDTSPR